MFLECLFSKQIETCKMFPGLSERGLSMVANPWRLLLTKRSEVSMQVFAS